VIPVPGDGSSRESGLFCLRSKLRFAIVSCNVYEVTKEYCAFICMSFNCVYGWF
jgi:hypothetical protein